MNGTRLLQRADLPELLETPAAADLASARAFIAIRRWRRQTEATDFGQPTAAETRWRVSVLPSKPLPVPGVGRARWQLELIRCRAGESADFTVEACDAKGRIALPSDVADGPLQKEIRRRRASA